MKILFYWVIENVGIVEIIEECWSLWHSFALWLYEKKKFRVFLVNCQRGIGGTLRVKPLT